MPRWAPAARRFRGLRATRSVAALDAPAARRVGWWSETSITAQATLTNNANYGESGDREGDLIIELIPAWNFHREGARLRVDGFVSLDMLGYVEGTQTSRILPQANVLANLEAIENLFFIDGSIVANQSVRQSVSAARGVLVDQQPVHVRAGTARAVPQGQHRP